MNTPADSTVMLVFPAGVGTPVMRYLVMPAAVWDWLADLSTGCNFVRRQARRGQGRVDRSNARDALEPPVLVGAVTLTKTVKPPVYAAVIFGASGTLQCRAARQVRHARHSEY